MATRQGYETHDSTGLVLSWGAGRKKEHDTGNKINNRRMVCPATMRICRRKGSERKQGIEDGMKKML